MSNSHPNESLPFENPDPRASVEEMTRLGFDLFKNDDTWMTSLREACRDVSFGTLGRFELLEEISRGGQGIVFKARDLNQQRVVALKRLLAGKLSTPENRFRFDREFKILSRLRHPGIARLLGSELIDGDPVILLEWIDGATFLAACSQLPSQRERLDLFLRVCDAVHYAHERGVIHRDLKPRNILVRQDGQPKILDFGLAKSFSDGDRGLTGTGEALGTPAYAAPEQLLDDAQSADARADIYSLGVILFELLTGKHPYEDASNVAKLLQAIEEGPTPLPTRVAPETPRDLEVIVRTALHRDLDQRYPSVEELALEIRRYLSGEAIHATPPSPMELLRNVVGRHKLMSLVLAMVMVLITGFAIVSTVQARRLQQEKESANQARKAAQDSEMETKRAFTQLTQSMTETDDVLHFLQSILSQLDPRLSRPNVTLNEVLDSALEKLETNEFRSQFATTNVRVLLAEAYYGLGQAPKTVALCQDAIAEPTDAAALRTELKRRDLLANALQDLGRFHEAEAVARSAIDFAHQHQIDEQGWDSRLPYSLGAILANIDKLEEAEESLRQGYALAQASGEIERSIQCLSILGSVLIEQDRAEEAKETFRRAVVLSEEHQLIKTEEYARASVSLTVLEEGSTQTNDVTLGQLARALEVYREVLGDDHPQTLYAQVEHGFATEGDDGFKMLEEAVSQLRTMGDTPRLAGALLHYSEKLRYRNRAQAREIAEHGLRLMDEFFGSESFGVCRMHEILGTIHLDSGRAETAMNHLEESLVLLEEFPSHDHITGRINAHLAKAYSLQDDHETAMELAHESAHAFLETLEESGRAPQQDTFFHWLETVERSAGADAQARAKRVHERLSEALRIARVKDVIRVAIEYSLDGEEQLEDTDPTLIALFQAIDSSSSKE